MSDKLFFYIAIGIFVLLIMAIALIYKKQKERGVETKIDYRTLFIIGITWIPLGFALGNQTFWILGLAFVAIGIANKNKWEEQKKWSDLSEQEKEKKKKALIILGLSLLVGIFAGVVIYFLI